MRSIRHSLFRRHGRCIRLAARHNPLPQLYLLLTEFDRLTGYNSRVNRIGRRLLLVGLSASFFALAASARTYELPPNSAQSSAWLLTDFDGDRLADLATSGPALREGRGYSHQISVELTGSRKTTFVMRGADQSILLGFRDVDGDNDGDLLILEPGSRRPVGVWLNDGSGHFTEGRISDYLARLGNQDPRPLKAAVVHADRLAGLHEERTSPAFSDAPVAGHYAPSGSFSFDCSSAPANRFSDGLSPRGPPVVSLT